MTAWASAITPLPRGKPLGNATFNDSRVASANSVAARLRADALPRSGSSSLIVRQTAHCARSARIGRKLSPVIRGKAFTHRCHSGTSDRIPGFQDRSSAKYKRGEKYAKKSQILARDSSACRSSHRFAGFQTGGGERQLRCQFEHWGPSVLLVSVILVSCVPCHIRLLPALRVLGGLL